MRQRLEHGLDVYEAHGVLKGLPGIIICALKEDGFSTYDIFPSDGIVFLPLSEFEDGLGVG
jgi:hypothetical protein